MATKKDIETVAEIVENAVESAAAEVKKAVKKAAPKAAETAQKAEKAVKKAVTETAEKAEKTVKKAAVETAQKAEKVVKKAAAEAGETLEKAEKTVRKATEKAAEKVGQAETKAKATAEAAKAAVRSAVAGEKKDAAKPAKKGKDKDAGEAKAFTEGPRLKKRYFSEIVPALREMFGYANVMQVPRLEKVILNMGLGAEKDNPKGIESAVREIGLITGQKAVVTRAKKSVANFKVREGMNVGAKVTLRGERMYYFTDKLVNIVLPRVRDFRGVSDKAFDGRGNFAMGLKEQLIFPEINYDDVDKVRGMNIVFVTSAETDEECKALLTLLGMPFVQQG